MRSFVLLTLAMLSCSGSWAQEDPLKDKIWFGPGLGLDHGGIGVRMDVRPVDQFGVFGGVGWAVGGLGWNAGLHVPLLTGRKANPYVTGMYGYNTVYAVKILNQATLAERTVYYGPSFGGGVEFPFRKGTRMAQVGLLAPIRPSQVLTDHPEIKSDLWPVLFTLGLTFRT